MGKFILIIGPSGVGKGTMVNLLKERRKDIVFPVSATTRQKRPGEREGDQYFFLTEKEFKEKIANAEFLEYACVHSENYYGILKEQVFDHIENGKIVVREVDYQGFLQVRENYPYKSLKSIFFMPPSIDVLKDRIRSRAPISEHELEERMKSIQKEMEVADLCDYEFISIDGDIEASFQKFIKLIDA